MVIVVRRSGSALERNQRNPSAGVQQAAHEWPKIGLLETIEECVYHMRTWVLVWAAARTLVSVGLGIRESDGKR